MNNCDPKEIRRRYWFLAIRVEDSAANLKDTMVERLEKYRKKHAEAKWAMNAFVCKREWRSTARIVILLKNAVSLASMKKYFEDCEFRLENDRHAVWSFLSCGKETEVDTIAISDNWTWDDIRDFPFSNRRYQTVQNVKVSVNNLFIVSSGKMIQLGNDLNLPVPGN